MKGVKLQVGAFYTTTDQHNKVVRVISTRVRELNSDGREVGAPKGYICQVIDGKYHSPFMIDNFGGWTDQNGMAQMILEQVASPLQKYIMPMEV